MTLEQLQQQISDLGFQGLGGLTGLSNLTGQNIQSQMENIYGLEGLLSPTMFQTINPTLLEGTLQKSYRPQIEGSTQNLFGDLYKTTQGMGGVQASGGFASSGGYQRFLDKAKDVYGKSATDVLQNVGKLKYQSVQGISDMVSNWQTQASEIAANQDS